MTRLSPREAILHHHRRGMSQVQLERIYGRDLVRSLIGTKPVAPATPQPFHKRLAARRAAASLSIHDVAKVIRVRPDHIVLYEEGKRRPVSPAIIIALAEFMGEDASALNAELMDRSEQTEAA